MNSRPFAFILLMTLSGCALWSDYQPPQTPTPDTWTSETAKGEKPGEWPDKGWWKQFHSEQLNSLMEEAYSSNFDLKAAVARVRQADAQARISGASLLPTLDASSNIDRTRQPFTSRTTTTSSGRVTNNYSGLLTAGYELDFWGKNWATSQSARALAEASRFDQQTVELTMSASVADTYFDILATKERLAVAQENVKNAEHFLASIRARFEQGVSTALDVAQQENVVATQRAAVPPLEQRLQQDLDAMAILVGKLPENVAVPQEKLAAVAVPVVTVGLPSELLLRRPDVKNAESQLASAHADIIAARAAFFPSIKLTGSSGYESAALANLGGPGSILWSVAGSLTQPIFEGGRLSGELERSEGRYEELLNNYQKAAISAFSDTEDALTAVKQANAEESAQKYAAETARKAYELTLKQLEGGIVDITTVLNTQRVLFAAEDTFLQAKLAHLQAVVGLYRALGGGWKHEKAAPHREAEVSEKCLLAGQTCASVEGGEVKGVGQWVEE